MLGTTSEEEEDETGSEDESSMDPKTRAALAKSAMEASPPPVTKKDWRLKAGKEDKGQKGKKGKKTKQPTKKPAASSTASKAAAKAAEKPKPHGNAGGPETKIDTKSLSIGGGKVQSYIQHMPNGPEGGKKLIVAVTLNQAKGTKRSHKQLVEYGMKTERRIGQAGGTEGGKTQKNGNGQTKATGRTMAIGKTKASGRTGKTKATLRTGKTKTSGRTMATTKSKASGWADDDWTDWPQDRSDEERATLKEAPWKPIPGSHKEKARLQKMQQVQGVPETAEARQVQRLSAMGQSRFNRLQSRLGKQSGGPPRYGELPSLPTSSQPSQPASWR
eukprot:s462_g74.t1